MLEPFPLRPQVFEDVRADLARLERDAVRFLEPLLVGCESFCLREQLLRLGVPAPWRCRVDVDRDVRGVGSAEQFVPVCLLVRLFLRPPIVAVLVFASHVCHIRPGRRTRDDLCAVTVCFKFRSLPASASLAGPAVVCTSISIWPSCTPSSACECECAG